MFRDDAPSIGASLSAVELRLTAACGLYGDVHNRANRSDFDLVPCGAGGRWFGSARRAAHAASAATLISSAAPVIPPAAALMSSGSYPRFGASQPSACARL